MNVASRVLVLMVTLVTAGLVSACAMRSGGGERPGQVLVVLLPDTDDGNVGRIVVSNPEGSTDLVTARASTRVTMTRAPQIRMLSESDVKQRFGDVLATLPPPPRHFTLPFRFESEELTEEGQRLRAGRVAGRQELSRSRRCRHRAHRYHRDAAVERGARTAARQRGAQSPRCCRAHAVDDRHPIAWRGRTAGADGGWRLRAEESPRRNHRAMIPRSRSPTADPAVRAGPHAPRRRAVAVSSVVFLSLENSVYDRLLRAVPARPPSDRIVIVDVDERSLAAVGQWPWRRDVIGELITRLREMGAAVIALDIVFAEAGSLRGQRRQTPDEALADTLRGGRVVLGYAMTFDGSPHAAEVRSPSRRSRGHAAPRRAGGRAVLPGDRRSV